MNNKQVSMKSLGKRITLLEEYIPFFEQVEIRINQLESTLTSFQEYFIKENLFNKTDIIKPDKIEWEATPVDVDSKEPIDLYYQEYLSAVDKYNNGEFGKHIPAIERSAKLHLEMINKENKKSDDRIFYVQHTDSFKVFKAYYWDEKRPTSKGIVYRDSTYNCKERDESLNVKSVPIIHGTFVVYIDGIWYQKNKIREKDFVIISKKEFENANNSDSFKKEKEEDSKIAREEFVRDHLKDEMPKIKLIDEQIIEVFERYAMKFNSAKTYVKYCSIGSPGLDEKNRIKGSNAVSNIKQNIINDIKKIFENNNEETYYPHEGGITEIEE